MLEKIKRREPLPVIELLLLDKFNGRRTDYILPAYELDEYGYDWSMRVQKLVRKGYLRIAEPQDALQALTVPELKNILRVNGQKLSGKKAELIARIAKNISAEKYSDQVPKIYSVTEIGRHELETRAFYLENKQMSYGFLNSELANLEKNTAPEMIFEKLFARDFLKHATAQNYHSLANTYERYRIYLKKHGRDEEALTALLSMIYLRLSGMADGNQVLEYHFLSWVFEDALWRRELDGDRTAMNLSDAEIETRFEAATESMNLPFTYFDKTTVIEIILERLHGQENLFGRYSSRRRLPNENSPAYEYYSGKRNRSIEVSVSNGPAANSGCFLPCIIFFAIILIVIK